MTYSYHLTARRGRAVVGVAVSHSAELVRGASAYPKKEGPLIRPFVPEARLRHDGPPSPQGEKGHARLARRNHDAFSHVVRPNSRSAAVAAASMLPSADTATPKRVRAWAGV